MTEITYQMVLSTLQTAGLLIGIIYYMSTLRNAQLTRKTQAARLLSERTQISEFAENIFDLWEMEWEDFDDYLRKYDSTVNRDNYLKRAQIFGMYQEAGYMLKKGIIDIETMYHLGNTQGTLTTWEKFKPVIMGYRERFNDPHWYYWFEYLANELQKERVRQGLPGQVSDVDGVLTKT